MENILTHKKEILFISSVFPPYKSGGGQSQVAFDYAKGLKKKGHNITVITNKFSGLLDNEIIEGIQILRLGNYSKILLSFGLYNPKQLCKYLLINVVKFDYVFIHDIYTLYGYIGARISRFKNTPYFFMPHGMGNMKKQKEKRVFKKIFTLLFSNYISHNSFKLIFCSEQEKEDYTLPYSKYKVLNNGIYQDKWLCDINKITLKDEQIIRKRYGLGDKKIILSIGRLVKAKGFNKLIEYISSFLKENEGYILCIIGPDGGEKDRISKTISRLGLQVQVKIIEGVYHQHIKTFFKISSVFTLASELEGSPIVISEAITSHTPCLVSQGCNTDTINGVIEIFYDKFDFLQKIKKLLGTSDILFNCIDIKQFDIQKSIDDFDKLLK